MKKKIIFAVIITGGLVLLSAFMLMLLFSFSMAAEEAPYESNITMENETGDAPSGYDGFAQCLTEKGVKMYGASWCGHCSNQKLAFGESWQYVDYVECSTPTGQAEECVAAGITGYPTWVFPDGERLSGERSFEELSQKSGCKLP